jgi:hypothetical protein
VPREKVQGAGSFAQMPRAERELGDELIPHAEPAERSPEVVAPMPAAVLRMQATAGNRATSDLLARAPDKGAVKEKAKAKATYTLTIPKRGEFPAQSLTMGNHDRDDIYMTLALEHGMRLQDATSDFFPTVTITSPSFTITLSEVVISAFSISGGTYGDEAIVTIALNAKKKEFK